MTYAEVQAQLVGIDAVTWEWLDKSFLGVPVITEGHVPTITLNKRRSGLTCMCSCGERLNRSSGCNAPGLVYSAYVANVKYRQHVEAQT